jgi:hypothetical protein
MDRNRLWLAVLVARFLVARWQMPVSTGPEHNVDGS